MTGRIYIDNDAARFEREDLTLVNVEFYSGERFERLEPRRLFPLTGITRYITLLNEEGDEIAVIRDLATLPPAEREIIEACLMEYYHIPKILRIRDYEEKGEVKFFCDTDRGDVTICINHSASQIQEMQGKRICFRDNDDNRYEIPDLSKMDRHTLKILEDFL